MKGDTGCQTAAITVYDATTAAPQNEVVQLQNATKTVNNDAGSVW